MRTIKLILLCLTMLTLFGGMYYGLNKPNSELDSLIMNKPVPTFKLQSLTEAAPLDHMIFQGGGYKLLNVWASWCAACKTEHPFLLDLAAKGIEIVGLNYRDNLNDARDVINQDGNPYTHIIYDPNGELALDLGVIGAPETFLIDSNGQIVFRLNGIVDSVAWRAHLERYFR